MCSISETIGISFKVVLICQEYLEAVKAKPNQLGVIEIKFEGTKEDAQTILKKINENMKRRTTNFFKEELERYKKEEVVLVMVCSHRSGTIQIVQSSAYLFN